MDVNKYLHSQFLLANVNYLINYRDRGYDEVLGLTRIAGHTVPGALDQHEAFPTN